MNSLQENNEIQSRQYLKARIELLSVTLTEEGLLTSKRLIVKAFLKGVPHRLKVALSPRQIIAENHMTKVAGVLFPCHRKLKITPRVQSPDTGILQRKKKIHFFVCKVAVKILQ